MNICLILKLIVYGLVCVFPVDIKGKACEECKTWSGPECKACDVGCYILANYWCRKCLPECYSCSSRNECDLCQTGLYGPRCNFDCVSCRDGSCSNETCTDGCADGYYHHEEDGGCQRCPNTCITCNSHSDCTSCVTGRTGSYCQNCKPGYYQKYEQCNHCNTNCLHDKCFDISGKCTDGCKDGWTGLECIEACGPNCVSCERNNGTVCTSLVSLQNSSITKGGTQDTKKSVNIAAVGVVGYAVLITVVAAAAVLGSIFFRKRRGKENGMKDLNNAKDDEEYNTLPLLTPTNRAAEIENVLNGNMGRVPVIPFSRLDVGEFEDNFEEICEGDVGVGNLKDADAPIVENYYNITGLTRSRVEVGKLRDHVASISLDDFKTEFIKLPKGLTRPYGDAVKQTNVLKNRYKGIYPYNSTRVKLAGNTGDYINASYIQGFDKSEKTYIASIGPTKKFMKGYEEFWEMVWQEKVDKIVMLTNFMEGSKMKCDKYWPDVGEHETYGDIIVHCMSAERYADFTVTKLSMKKDSQVAGIHHFHFTEWPDQGTPENVTSLVEFRESVEHVQKITKGPIVVHCSAGVGRTGTYIALDILTREGQSENYVDVYGCVLALRGQRVFMIQTVKQYQFLYYSLSYSLTNKCDQITSKDFCTVKTDEIQRQFQLLRTVNVQISNGEQSAPETNGDAHIPRLKYNQKSKSDYINAIYVDGYKEKNRYIIARTPVSRTVEDFLALVVQESCFCIISLDSVGISRKQDIGEYLPDVSQELYFGNVKISCTQRKTTPDYILSKLNVSLQAESTEDPKPILHYQYTAWPEASPVPSSTGSFLNLVLDSRRYVSEPNMPIKPVIIHCLAWGDRCGLFPVVSNILEKINSEQQASIVNVVSQVRARRHCAIPNQEQFKYCYELASLFVEKSVYSNLL